MFNECNYNNEINNFNKPNKIKKNKTKKNKLFSKFNFMSGQEFNENLNNKTLPKKDSFEFNKSKSQPINYQEDEVKLNFIKYAFKSYISSNKIK